METRKGQGEGEPSRATSEASSGADGGTGNSVSVVCDHPPGLRDELPEHIEAPNMEAGGSHPQATMMQEDSAAPAAASLLPETQSLRPAGKNFSGLKGEGRGARPRSVTRVRDATALVFETVGFYVKATRKEALMRQQLANYTPEKIRLSWKHWCAQAAAMQRVLDLKEEAGTVQETVERAPRQRGV